MVPADVGLLRGKGWRNKWRSSKGSGSGGGRDRGSGGGGGEEAEAAGSGGGVRPGNAVFFLDKCKLLVINILPNEQPSLIRMYNNGQNMNRKLREDTSWPTGSRNINFAYLIIPLLIFRD